MKNNKLRKKNKKREKGTIKEMQDIAKKRGGKCLSTEYVNNRTKLIWECEKGHKWEAIPYSIKNRGIWCPECQCKKKGNIEKMQEIAEKRGGKCLSTKYVNNRTKLIWECENSHQWEATPSNVNNYNKWCPICNERVSERICRKFFELIFNSKFSKSKPSWLKNNQGNQMELDGYCIKLKIAFEYQGQQHYEYIPYFHKNKNKFERRLIDDETKRLLCKNNGIKLIIVPYTINSKDMQNFIIQQCEKQGIQIPNQKKIDYNKFDISSQIILEEMREIAKKRGGKCLSIKYINNKNKLKWECKRGHKWEALPGNIKSQKNWCPKCAGKEKGTIKEMKEIAKKRKGKCLSIKYINNRTNLEWECDKGHQWKATPISIKNHSSWCPECLNNKGTIEEMQEIAKKRGGRCLSILYVNSKSKLIWECKMGHQWQAIPSNVKNMGTWCPKCRKKTKLI